MITQTFEIKVAILGYVSVGKTTVLNALLQDKFSEVSMRRTTAGINLFRIVSPPTPTVSATSSNDDSLDSIQDATMDDNKTVGWSLVPDTAPRLASSTLQEITADNQKLRETKNTIQEKTFEIQLNETLCVMRPDTSLVLIDVPGLNEADSKLLYQNYVKNKWNTFDCVVVVMDAEKGVNTDEQVELLQMVKGLLDECKEIPVIVLCNKVDDPDNEDLMTLVQEMQHKVEEIFHVSDRTESLVTVMTAFETGKHNCSNDGDMDEFPMFLPVSAGNAFAYRTAGSHGSIDKFKQLDMKLIDKLGREEVGPFQWKRLSTEEKYTTAFAAVSDAKQYQERLQATNFDKFLKVLAYTIGGDEVQCKLLAKQMEVTLQQLSVLGDDDEPLAKQLHSIHDKCKVLKQDSTHLKATFWDLYNVTAHQVYAKRLESLEASSFIGLMDELLAYSNFVRQVGWFEEERDMIHQKMEELVRRQIAIIGELEREWKIDDADIGRFRVCWVWQDDYGWYETADPSEIHSTNREQEPGVAPWHWKREGTGWRNVYTDNFEDGDETPVSRNLGVTWKTLTYHDWVTILSSVLFVSNSRHFYVRFGHEKILLEGLLQRHSFFANRLATGTTVAEQNALHNIYWFTQGKNVDGTFVPTDPLKYKTVYQIENPRLLTDAAHWGNLAWKYCNYMDQRET